MPRVDDVFLCVRLQAQLQEKDSDHSEAVKSLEAKHIAEVQKLKELLATSESTNTELHNEVQNTLII